MVKKTNKNLKNSSKIAAVFISLANITMENDMTYYEDSGNKRFKDIANKRKKRS